MDWDALGTCMEDGSRAQALLGLPAKVRGVAGRFKRFLGC